MSVDALPVDLGLDAVEAQARFDGLQEKLVPLWKSMERMTHDEQTIVVVCSMTLEDPNMPAAVLQAYEERFLFLLLLLRQPRARLVYVTSQAIHTRASSTTTSACCRASSRRTRASACISSRRSTARRGRCRRSSSSGRGCSSRSAARSPIPTVPTSSPSTRPSSSATSRSRSASRCTAPIHGSSPTGRRPAAGGSSRSRACASARARGPVHDRGAWRSRSPSCARSKPGLSQVIVKLNEGVSGEGNALLDLTGLSDGAGTRRSRNVCASCSSSCRRSPTTSYVDMLEKRGGVVEERILGEEFRSPSVQMRVTPLGKLEVLSTHDQLLGGPSGQSYLGCIFPADPGYATAITREAVKVGERLASEGVIGRFAMDFVAVKDRGRKLGALRDRAQSPQGRHDASVPHAPVPHGRGLRSGYRGVHRAERQAEVLRRLRPRRERRVPRADGRTTSSTLACAPAFTSTSRGRPASSST